jgi:hypothetical protein
MDAGRAGQIHWAEGQPVDTTGFPMFNLKLTQVVL